MVKISRLSHVSEIFFFTSKKNCLFVSASLFYIVKGPEKDNLNTELKRSIVRAVLSAMENHMQDATVRVYECL